LQLYFHNNPLNTMKKLYIISISTILSLLLNACQSTDQPNNKKGINEKEERTNEQQENKAKKAETFTVGKTTTQRTKKKTNQPRKIGIIEPFQKATIKSEVAGKIKRFNATEGEEVNTENPIVILGPSLNADIKDINFKNALTSLENAKKQLAEKHKANQKTLENTKLTIDKAAIQLDTANKTRTNLDHSTELNLIHLEEQNQNSYYQTIEHIRDVTDLGRSALNANPNSYNYNEIENQIRYLEEGLSYNHFTTNPNELNNLIHASESLLSNLKTFTSNTYTDNNYRFHDSAYHNDFNDNETQTTNNNSTTNSYETTPQTSPNTAIQTRIKQLQPITTQYKSSLLKSQQGIEKNDNSYVTKSITANSQLALAEIQLENARQLFELRKIQQQLEEQQLEDKIEQLEGQVDLANRNRKTHEIKAPFSGTLIKKLVKEGEQINPGQAIAEIGTTDKLKVILKVTQSEIEKLHLKQKVTVINPRNEEIEGKIISLPISFNPQTKTGDIEIEVPNKPIKFITGMTVNVIFTKPKSEEETSKGIWIPISSVYFRDNDYVFIIKKGKAKKQIIEPGSIKGNMIEIEKGLKKDDQIILNRFEIKEGTKIESK